MFILPIKSRLQILSERKNPEFIWNGKSIMMFVSPTPKKNSITNSQHRAENFVRLVVVVTKKIHKRAVVRNKFRRRIKEAFRLIDKSLFKNKYDYQIIAKQSIFKSTVHDLIVDIENCLSGKAAIGFSERNFNNIKKSKNKYNKIKTSDALKVK